MQTYACCRQKKKTQEIWLNLTESERKILRKGNYIPPATPRRGGREQESPRRSIFGSPVKLNVQPHFLKLGEECE